MHSLSSVPRLFERLIYAIEASIGGYVVIIDREQNDRHDKYTYIGTTKELFYEYHWDTIKPYHCMAIENKTFDCPQFLTVPDLTEEVSFYNALK